jgi:hypothetical protein
VTASHDELSDVKHCTFIYLQWKASGLALPARASEYQIADYITIMHNDNDSTDAGLARVCGL